MTVDLYNKIYTFNDYITFNACDHIINYKWQLKNKGKDSR